MREQLVREVSTLQCIENLLEGFILYEESDTSRIKQKQELLNSTYSAQGYLTEHLDDGSLIRERFRAIRHYENRATILCCLLRQSLSSYQSNPQSIQSIYLRIEIDVEMLVISVRSFLDAIFELLCHKGLAQFLEISLDAIPKKKQGSFGKFSDWYEKEKPELTVPHLLLAEIANWGLTLRSIRDLYIHKGKEPNVYFDDDKIYLIPVLRYKQSSITPFPDEFEKIQVGDREYISLEQFLTYCIAPVHAIEAALGKYLKQEFSEKIPNWEKLCPGLAYCEGLPYESLYEMLSKHQSLLKGSIFEHKYA